MRTCIGLCLASIVSALIPADLRAQSAAAKQAAKAEGPRAALTALQVYPPQIVLDGPRAEQRIGLVGVYADGRHWDLSRDAKITSNADSVAAVDRDGVVRPVGDGTTTLTIAA